MIYIYFLTRNKLTLSQLPIDNMGFADEWFLHPLIPEFEKEMIAGGMEIEKEEARKLAKNEELPPHEVVEWCSEGREKRKIADRFGFKNKKIIEIGCGRGYYTQFLAREGNAVCALDKMIGNRENHMLDEFKEVMKGHEEWDKVLPLQADARDIPIPDDTFDIATCASFFRDLYPQDVQKEIISEMARISEGMKIAVYVDKDLDKAQQNFYDQLELRKKAQKALDVTEKHWSHVPYEPSEVKSWFEDIVDIEKYEFLDPDLKGEWAGNVEYYINKLEDSHPKKEGLVEELEELNKKIDEYKCKRPTIMLIKA